MEWEYAICLFTQTHCASRGLRGTTIAAYTAALKQFHEYLCHHHDGLPPGRVSPRVALEYVVHLREERGNGDSAINRTVTILKNFYRALVAMAHLEQADNPLAHFPKMKAPARKLPTVLSADEVQRLLEASPTDTILGLRDRAILTLLYGTGIRASECATLREEHVDLSER